MKAFISRIIPITAILSLLISVCAYAAGNEYSVSAINLTVTIPDELNVLTRNVSDGNAALEKLEDATAAEILNTFINNDIYLDIFPDDISFEIIVASTKVDASDAKDFSELSDNEFTDYMEKLASDYEKSEDSKALKLDLYTGSTAKYVVTKAVTTADTLQVYTLRYYTVTGGYNYYYTLQSNDEAVFNNSQAYLTAVIDSADYNEVAASITESSVFMEMLETFIGFGVTIAVLGIVLLMVSRASKRR